MAGAEAIEKAYGWMEPFYKVIPGGDITAGMFDSNYERSLTEAQKIKHDFVLDSLGVKEGTRFFDVGCGAGPLVEAAHSRGASASGITLDRNQAKVGQKKGLDIHHGNFFSLKTLPEGAGTFDAVSCVEAMEHFCGVTEFKEGQQDEIYGDFFRRTSALLKDGGKMFLQTVVFGPNAPRTLEEISLSAPKGSNQQVTAGLLNLFPDSISPQSLEQVVKCAEPYFDVVATSNGVNDYVETLDRWGDLRRLSISTVLPKVRLGVNMVHNRELRERVLSLKEGFMKQSFRRGIIDHWRIIFQKKSDGFSIENAAHIALRVSDMLNALGISSSHKSLSDELESVCLENLDFSGQERTLAFVHKPTAKVFLEDPYHELLDGDPDLDKIITWQGKDGKVMPTLYTEATSLQLNSVDFWQDWSSQFKN